MISNRDADRNSAILIRVMLRQQSEKTIAVAARDAARRAMPGGERGGNFDACDLGDNNDKVTE